MRLFDRRILTAGLALALGAGAVGCESNTGSGALIGGAAGAGLGGLIGSYSHARAGEGALIGGAIGAASGALIGNAADQQERDAYRRQSEWRYEDYPVESREYRYYRLEPAPPPPPVQYRYEYRETRYGGHECGW
jgi:hypothetical protein